MRNRLEVAERVEMGLKITPAAEGFQNFLFVCRGHTMPV
jgi:hypothetical protein